MNDFKFGNFLYEKRTAKGLSQAELGAMLGVSNKAVSKWESGAAKPQTAKLIRLAEILEVRVEELLAGEKIPAVREPASDSQKEALIRQWMNTRRIARIFAWILAAALLQIPLGIGILVSVFRVNDDVGAAYVLCTVLLILSAAILTAGYGVSQRRQRKMILRLYATDPAQPRGSSPPVCEAPTLHEISSDFRLRMHAFERRLCKLLLVWILFAALPVLLYLSILFLSYTFISGWDSLLYVIVSLYVGGFVWQLALPIHTVVSLIVILLERTRLFSAYREEYVAYCKEKQMATKRVWSHSVAIVACYIVWILSAVRIFFSSSAPEIFLSGGLFVALLILIVVMLCKRIRRCSRQMAALTSDVSTQS